PEFENRPLSGSTSAFGLKSSTDKVPACNRSRSLLHANPCQKSTQRSLAFMDRVSVSGRACNWRNSGFTLNRRGANRAPEGQIGEFRLDHRLSGSSSKTRLLPEG